MKIDETKYKGYTIEVYYEKESKTFYGTSAIAASTSHENVKKAFKAVKKLIDDFLSTKISNYVELAMMITETLIWTSDSDCYADEQVIESLVESYMKTIKNK